MTKKSAILSTVQEHGLKVAKSKGYVDSPLLRTKSDEAQQMWENANETAQLNGFTHPPFNPVTNSLSRLQKRNLLQILTPEIAKSRGIKHKGPNNSNRYIITKLGEKLLRNHTKTKRTKLLDKNYKLDKTFPSFEQAKYYKTHILGNSKHIKIEKVGNKIGLYIHKNYWLE